MRGLGKCQIEGCGNGAKWGTYKTFLDGSKKWLYVCDGHEREIGDENLARADPNWRKVKNFAASVKIASKRY